MKAILDKKQQELDVVSAKIQKIEGVKYASDDVAKHFPLGRVGGSGRNNHRLNKQREKDLEKTIENSKRLIALYKQRDRLELEIKQLNEGTWKSDDQRKQERKERNELALKIEKDQDKNNRKSMSFEERLFIADFGGGTSYSDQSILKNGDFKKLAFKSRNTGEVTWYAKRIPTELRELIEQHIKNH